jgi:hypothetical protein
MPHLAHEVDDADDEQPVLAIHAEQQAVVHHPQSGQERRVRRQRRVQPADIHSDLVSGGADDFNAILS